MRCLKCAYPLAGITMSHCPECGHAFDPSDSRTFDHPDSSRRQQRRRWHIALIACTVPAPLSVLSMVMCWIVASIVLGHPPRSSIDDPKNLPVVPFLRALWLLTMVLAMSLSPFAMILAGLLAWIMPAPPPELRRSRIVACVCSLTLGLSLACFLLLDKMLVPDWLMD